MNRPNTTLLFSALLFASSSALSAPLVKLNFDASLKPETTPMQINNMESIGNIYTYGPYAIATGATPDKQVGVSFFNGKTWSDAQPIPGALNIDGIYPSYPQTGKQATAWATVETQDPKTGMTIDGVDYFDGQHWLRSPQIVSTALNLPNNQMIALAMAASGGTAYLIAGYIDAQGNDYTRYAISNTNTPTTWKIQKDLPGNTGYWSYETDSFNDNTGNLYLAPDSQSSSGNQSFKLYQSTPAGALTTYNLPGSDSNNATPTILTDSGRVFANYNKLAYNNNAGQGQWSTTNPMSNSSLLSLHENHGLVCDDIFDARNPQNPLSLHCIDATQSNALWKPTLHVTDGPSTWQMVVRNDGAWFYHLDNVNGSSPAILDYSSNTNTLYNTNFPMSVVYPGSRVIMRNIAPANLVIACGLNANTHQPEYRYYQHGNTKLGWQTINTTNMGLTQFCGYSFGGNTQHLLSSVDTSTNETLWLFNDPMTLNLHQTSKRASTLSQQLHDSNGSGVKYKYAK